MSPTLMSPESAFSSPISILNSVVLPTPLGPITPTIPVAQQAEDTHWSMSRRSP